jgi:hypothetical protein
MGVNLWRLEDVNCLNGIDTHAFKSGFRSIVGLFGVSCLASGTLAFGRRCYKTHASAIAHNELAIAAAAAAYP